MKPITLMASSVLVLAVPAFASDADSAHLGYIESGYDSNLFNTPQGNNPITSATVAAGGGQQTTWMIDGKRAVQAEFSVALQHQLYDPDLLEASISATGNYLWQSQPGFTAPWHQLTLATGLSWHQFTDYQHLKLALSGHRYQRLTDKMQWNLSTELNSRIYRQSLLNQTQVQLQTGVDWQWREPSLLYTQALGGYGQVHSSYSGTLAARSHHLVGEVPSGSISDDYFLDQGLSHITGSPWFSYRYLSAFGQLSLGWNQRLSQAFALDANYRWGVQASEQISYQKHSVSLSLLWRPVR